MKFYTALKGFISSAVKNVATNGFPLLSPEGIREATATLYVPPLKKGEVTIMVIERRRYSRAEVIWPAGIITTLRFMSGEIKDISLGGAFICCRESLKPKEVFEMHFTDLSQGSRIKVTAEVCWSNISDPDDESQPRGMGVRFATISDEDRKVLSTLISNHPKLA